MANRRSAFTLVEMVVYCGLLSIFGTIFFVSLPSKHNNSLENLSYSAEQSGLVLGKIHREVSNSRTGMVTLLGEGAGLAFPSALDSPSDEYSYDQQGELQWSSWVAYERRDDTLNRFEYRFEEPAAAALIDPLESLLNTMQKSVRRVASEVHEFQVEAFSGGFRVTLSIDVKGERIRNVTTMVPRN